MAEWITVLAWENETSIPKQEHLLKLQLLLMESA